MQEDIHRSFEHSITSDRLGRHLGSGFLSTFPSNEALDFSLTLQVPSILYTALWSFAIPTQQDSPDTSRQLLYASRVLLQVALSCTQLSQASLCNRFGWDGRRSNVSLLMNASLGLLATIAVSLPPRDEVSGSQNDRDLVCSFGSGSDDIRKHFDCSRGL